MKFATVGGVTLHYADEGLATGAGLFFLNSLGTDLRIWDGLMPWFAGRYRLLRVDQRGHGLSDCPPGPYTVRLLAGDVMGLLDWLGVERVVVVGDSVGGMVALDLAIAYPERVRGVVACDTAAKIGTVGYWRERLTAVCAHGIAHLAEPILSRWFAPGYAVAHPAAYRGYANMLTRTPLAGYVATCEAIRDADLRAQVGQIVAPALVLCGAEDGATPPELVAELARGLPNGRFQLIPNAGHIPSIEQPEVMATMIDQFLQEIGYV